MFCIHVACITLYLVKRLEHDVQSTKSWRKSQSQEETGAGEHKIFARLIACCFLDITLDAYTLEN